MCKLLIEEKLRAVNFQYIFSWDACLKELPPGWEKDSSSQRKFGRRLQPRSVLLQIFENAAAWDGGQAVRELAVCISKFTLWSQIFNFI